MPQPEIEPASGTRRADAATAWYVPIARAIPALVLAVVIAFTADHSPSLGLVSFGIVALASGAIITASALRAGAHGVARTLTIAQGLVTVAAGIASISFVNGGLPYFVFLLTAWAAIAGFLELYLGLRSGARARSSRDRIFVGALTAVLAVVVLLVPPDFAQAFSGPDGVVRQLTASVIVVGTLGAYWAIAGIYLVIAGLSLKWDAATTVSEA